MPVKDFSVFIQRDAVSVSIKERDPQLLLQRFDMIADSRGDDVKFCGCFADIIPFGDPDKIF